MCRRNECERFTFPVAVLLKRLAAPLCVFNFGMSLSVEHSAIGTQSGILDGTLVKLVAEG